jgi:peroxiredoxin
MSPTDSLHELPDGILAPVGDGACDHLPGMRLPSVTLSDEKLEYAEALNLPTFDAEDKTLLKRLTLVMESGRIETIFYPTFPPNKNTKEVLELLSERTAS